MQRSVIELKRRRHYASRRHNIYKIVAYGPTFRVSLPLYPNNNNQQESISNNNNNDNDNSTKQLPN